MNSGTLIRTFGGALLLVTASAFAGNWPEWRGPQGIGLTAETNLPLRWSATENVRWKTPLPDRGNSTPIVWANRVFLTQAIENEDRRLLLCFDRATGKELWRAGTTHELREKSHRTNPQCSASPVTDGERVIAWFGSAGLFCYNFDGQELWRRDLGQQEHEWGYGSSPVIYKDLVLLHFGPGERSFLIALNKKTGERAWQVDIPEIKPAQRTDGFAGDPNGIVGSWSTPILASVHGRDELIVSLAERLRAFDPNTGRELWRCEGLNPLIYTSAIYGEGIAVGMGGFHGTTIAVKAGGNGDVTKTHRLWETRRTKNRLGSGVVHDGHVYILDTPGIAQCIELKTGEILWDERVRGSAARGESWSSMVLSGDRIYILNQSGETIVLRASPKFEVLATNALDGELTNSSHAVSDGDIFIRTHAHLWCISEKR